MTLSLVAPADEDRMFHAASHILGVLVAADRPVRVRHNRVLAVKGQIEFWHEGQAIADEVATKVEGQGWRRALADKEVRSALDAGFDAELAGHVALAGQLKVHRASGSGQVWLGHHGGDISIFELDRDGLVVLAQSQILAHDDSIATSLEDVLPREMVVTHDTVYAWVLRGTGLIASATPGEVVTIDVDEGDPILVEAEALLAYTEGISLAAPDDYNRRAAMREIKWLLKNIPQVNLETDRERVWMIASGVGTLVVRASD